MFRQTVTKVKFLLSGSLKTFLERMQQVLQIIKPEPVVKLYPRSRLIGLRRMLNGLKETIELPRRASETLCYLSS